MDEQSVEQLFGAAIDLLPQERRAFLESGCRNRPEVRLLVEELLRDHDRAGSFMNLPLVDMCGPAEDGSLAIHMPSDPFTATPCTAPRFGEAQLIAGRFVVVRFIDRGGMGEVYEAEDQLLQNDRVALKIIRSEIAADAGSSHRFQQEVILARKVHHPNLCPIYEIFQCEQPPPAFLFLTMKLLRGETLHRRLRSGESFTSRESNDICMQIIAGVAALHAAGIIHRDIKPNNIMVERSGKRLCVSVMDFGLARLHESEVTLQKTGAIAGTPGYIAPELIKGQRPSQASDLFALGVVLHQVLTGEYPVESRSGLSVTPASSLRIADASAVLIQSVKDLLSNDPEERCCAFERMQTAFQLRQEPAPRPVRLLSRRSFAVTAAASAFALAAGVGWEHQKISDFLHPLPRKRFVALLNWPPSSDLSVRPLLSGVIDAIASQLARAEAFDHNFFVAAQRYMTDMTTSAQVNEVRESLGANLVLAASGASGRHGLRVLLQVLDASTLRPIRTRQLEASADERFALPDRAVRAAAELLNVAQYEPGDAQNRTGSNVPEALGAFQTAEALLKQPNNSGLAAAIASYETAVDADRHFANAHAHLAIAYLRLYIAHRDPTSIVLARGNAERAVELNPRSPEAHVALGSVYQQTGAESDALHEFAQALSIDPGDARTLSYQALIYWQLNRLEEAEETYKRVLRLRPNFWLAYDGLGNTYNCEGKYQSALEAFRTASALAPRNAGILNNVASMYFQLGDSDGAITAVDKSILMAASGDAFQTRADIFRAQGKFTQSLAAATEAAKLDPEEGTNWLEVGDACELLHRGREAQTAYERAVRLQTEKLTVNPKDGRGWMLLALYRTKSGDPDGSPAMVDEAESLGASDIFSQLSKARILEVLGRRDEALAVLGPCIKRGATRFQIEATHDLDLLRADSRYSKLWANPVIS